MTGSTLAVMGLLLLVVIVTLAAASFFPRMLVAAVTLIAVPVAVLLFALVGVHDAAFILAALAIVACLTHTITDTFSLVITPSRRTASTAQDSSQSWPPRTSNNRSGANGRPTRST